MSADSRHRLELGTRRESGGSPLAGRDVIVGIDLGTTSFKAVAVDEHDLTVSSSKVASPFVASGSRVEMRFDAMLEQVKRLLSGLDLTRHRVAGIGIASIGESGAVIGPGGDVCTPIVAWHDPRGHALAKRLRARFSGPRWDVIGRPMRAKSSIALLAYWTHSGVPVRKWLGVAELLTWALTGEMVSEPSLAARTCAYDITRDRYEPEILEAIGAPTDVFPAVAPAGTNPVMSQTEYAADIGLRTGTPVTVAGHDHPVGALGIGAGLDELVDSLGTSELLLRYSEHLPLSEALSMGVEAARAPGGESWALTVCPAHSGALLADLSAALGGFGYDQLGRLAEAAPAKSDVPLPKLRGQGAEARFSQLPLAVSCRSDGEVGLIWAAAIEQLAVAAANRADELDQIAGLARQTLIIGGGARNEYWMSRKAALGPGRPLRYSQLDEAAAYGAVVLARRAERHGMPGWPGPPVAGVADPAGCSEGKR